MITEYDTWYELEGYDGFHWEFIADFDTRELAEQYVKEVPENMDWYEHHRIKKCKGQA